MDNDKSNSISIKAIENAFKYFTIIASFFVVAAYLKLYIYYKFFNISIAAYIEPGEILLLFSENLINAFPIVFIILLPYYIIQKKYDNPSNLQHRKYVRNIFLAILFTILFSLSMIFITIFQEFILWYECIIIILVVFINTFLIAYLIVKRTKLRILNFKTLFIITLILLCTISIVSAINDYYKIGVLHIQQNRIEIQLKVDNSKDKFDTLKDIVYIGKTRNYLFYSEEQEENKKTFIIPINRINEIIIKSNVQ